MKSIIRGLGLLCAIAVASAAPVRAQAPTEIRLATLAPSALLWLHAIANDQGFYKERNIVVKDLRAGSSPALLQAVSSGSVEAGVSLGDVVMRAIDKGAPVIISGAVLEKAILQLVGGKGVTEISQLKGATVTAGAVQGGTANLLRYQLKRGGVDPNDVKMVSLTNSKDRVVALGNGQVKGALLIAPFDTLAVRDGMKVLDTYKDYYVETPLILNKDWAAKNRPAAIGLTKALQKAANWIYDPKNKQKAIDILAAYTKTPADICAASYKFIIEEQKAVGHNLEVPAAGLENITKIEADVGNASDKFPPFQLSKYYDPSYLNAK